MAEYTDITVSLERSDVSSQSGQLKGGYIRVRYKPLGGVYGDYTDYFKNNDEASHTFSGIFDGAGFYEITAVANSGFSFAGWRWSNGGSYFDVSNTTKEFNVYTSMDDDGATIYAAFSVKNPGRTYTATLHCYADNKSTTKKTVAFADDMPTYGGASSLARNGFSGTGYGLQGFWDQPLGKGVKYYNADGTSAHKWDKLASADLYAYWKAPLLVDNTETDSGGAKLGNKAKLFLGSSATGDQIATEGDDGVCGWNKNKNVDLTVQCTPKDNGRYVVGLDTSGDGSVGVNEPKSDAEKSGNYVNNSQRVTFQYARAGFVGRIVYEAKPRWSVSVWKSVNGSESLIGSYGNVEYRRGGYGPNSALLTDPDDKSSGKWFGGPLFVVVTPSEHRRIASYSINGVNPISYGQNGSLVFSFAGLESAPANVVRLPYLSENKKITLAFEAETYTLAAQADSASASAITAVSVVCGERSGASLTNIQYNESVTFSATVAEGYSFAGWYNAEGTRVSTEQAYTIRAASDMTLTAKASAPVSVSFEDGEGNEVEGSFVSFSGDEYADGSAVLGSEVDYSFNGDAADVSWFVAGWYDASDASREHPLSMANSGRIAVAGVVSLVVVLSATDPVRTLTVNAYYNGSLISGLSNFVSFDGGADSGSSGAASATRDGNGDMSVRVVKPQITVSDTLLAFGGWQDSSGNALDGGQLASRTFMLAGDMSVRAVYVAAVEKNISVAVASADRGKGTVDRISDNGDGMSTAITAGNEIVLCARPANGFGFAGWYLDETKISDETEYTHVVVNGAAFVAKFVEATNAVFLWEGSETNKMMTWRSKVYVSTRPFSPSACRVDVSLPADKVAEVEADDRQGATCALLRVEMYSSPDEGPRGGDDEAAPANGRRGAVELVDVGAYRAQRIPVVRAERYMAVEVRNDAEVDRVIVGTSMGGLAV